MKGFFRFMASATGRILRSIIGFAFMAWGYNSGMGEWSIYGIVLGLIIFLLALFDISLLAPLLGYPILGRKIRNRYGSIQAVPGEDPAAPDLSETIDPPSPPVKKDVYATGSTTQGGSNYGQGSMQLSGNSNQQGSEKNSGANYADEDGRIGDRDNNTLDQKPS